MAKKLTTKTGTEDGYKRFLNHVDLYALGLDSMSADIKRDVLAGDEGAGRREHALHTGACIGRATHDLNGFVSLRDLADIDHADAQTIRVGMFLGRDHRSNHKWLEQARFVLDALDLEPDHGEPVDDLIERGDRVEMFFEPGQSEFHGLNPPASVGKSSGRKP